MSSACGSYVHFHVFCNCSGMSIVRMSVKSAARHPLKLMGIGITGTVRHDTEREVK